MELYGAADSLGLAGHDIPKFLFCKLDLLWKLLWLLDFNSCSVLGPVQSQLEESFNPYQLICAVLLDGSSFAPCSSYCCLCFILIY